MNPLDYWSPWKLSALFHTQDERCLGCAAWTVTGCDCPSYYGTGDRVDYELWCRFLETRIAEPLFNRWAAAEPMLGLPSYFTREQRAEVRLRSPRLPEGRGG